MGSNLTVNSLSACCNYLHFFSFFTFCLLLCLAAHYDGSHRAQLFDKLKVSENLGVTMTLNS